MNTTVQLFEGVVIMMALIILFAFLRKIGILEKSNSKLTSTLVLKVTLPAIIFSSLIAQKFDIHLLISAGIVSTVEIICIAMAWLIAKSLKLGRGETGALMLVSAFGMSTMLGYPIVRQVFPNNIQAMSDAIVTSEFGVGFLLFVIGPIIAMYYGESEIKGKVIVTSIKEFLVSPIIMAIVLGIIVSTISFPENNQVIITVKHLLKLMGNANLLLVAVTIGLLLEPLKISKYYGFLITAIILKLIIQPGIAQLFANTLNVDSIAEQIILIETSMPSAILIAIFAKQYNCKPELVSTTILVTLTVSLISVTAFFGFLY